MPSEVHLTAIHEKATEAQLGASTDWKTGTYVD